MNKSMQVGETADELLDLVTASLRITGVVPMAVVKTIERIDLALERQLAAQREVETLIADIRAHNESKQPLTLEAAEASFARIRQQSAEIQAHRAELGMEPKT